MHIEHMFDMLTIERMFAHVDGGVSELLCKLRQAGEGRRIAMYRKDSRVPSRLRGRGAKVGRRAPHAFTPTEIAVLALIGVALCAAAVSPAIRGPRPGPASYASVTVDDRDTLWNIAADHPVDGLSTADTVAVIREVNGLDSAVIHPGQVLTVPSGDTAAMFARR